MKPGIMIRLVRGRGRGASTQFSFVPKKVFHEVDNVIHGLKIQRCGMSNAAPLPSDIPKVQKVYKRVSKDKRRTMVLSFVNKYREAHDGKFPSLYDVHKEVGGSYYVVRDIFQELQSKVEKSFPSGEKKNLLGVGQTKEKESVIKCENALTGRVIVDVPSQINPGAVSVNGLDGVEPTDKPLEEQRGQISMAAPSEAITETLINQDQIRLVATQNTSEDEGTDTSDPVPKKSQDKASGARSDPPHLMGTENHLQELGADGVSLPSSGKVVKDHEEQKHDFQALNKDLEDTSHGQHQEKSTLWGNLKSFADGIVNFWKKL